jgi:muramidase (phage lysozyme)
MDRAALLAIAREPNVAAFLRVIRACEGTAGENGYAVTFGYEPIPSLHDHPRRKITKGGYTSTAAGAYQFLERTWDEMRDKYALPDFSPESQDAAAVGLLIRRKALSSVRAGLLDRAVELCNREWASLPGSPYGQPVRTMGFVHRVYEMHGGKLHANNDIAAPAVNPVNPDKVAITMAPVLAALLPSLVSAIPALAKIFASGSAVSERNTKAAEAVAAIVVEAVGAPNLQGAVETIQSDPAARLRAANAVEAQWYTLVEAGGGGIDGARKFNVAVASAEPWKMPAVWISSALLALVFMVVGTVLWAEGWSNDIRLQVVTATLTIIGMVGSFWLGTSASSARKDDALFRSADR